MEDPYRPLLAELFERLFIRTNITALLRSGSTNELKRGVGLGLRCCRIKRSSESSRRWEQAMSDVALIRPLDEAAALGWLRRQPGMRTNLPAAELGRRWGWR
jgi:hypothetical protein